MRLLRFVLVVSIFPRLLAAQSAGFGYAPDVVAVDSTGKTIGPVVTSLSALQTSTDVGSTLVALRLSNGDPISNTVLLFYSPLYSAPPAASSHAWSGRREGHFGEASSGDPSAIEGYPRTRPGESAGAALPHALAPFPPPGRPPPPR